ncbi:MAG TPA: bifunctional DNA-formamidopyrimidine glycosylase/DNA-(apurinic or apyrimidinic site) lyase [Gemmatimonadaceae bacterium]
MPELPEVEHAVRRLRRALHKRTITGVELLHPSLRRRLPAPVVAALRGARVAAVERRGKHQLIRLADGRVLHAHFRMTGDWVVAPSGAPLPRFARAVFTLDDGRRLVLDDSRALATLDVHPADAPVHLALGVEPMDPQLTPDHLHACLAARRGPIKSALLDQRVIAGLGNIYAAEALWRARISPRARASSLSRARLMPLIAAVRAVIARATGARYTDAGAARLNVYDREGLPCRRCRTPIRRIVQSGRSTYYCPRCQR